MDKPEIPIGPYCTYITPYLRKKGPMGGALYIGPRLGDGPIFEVSVLLCSFSGCSN